MHVCSADDQMPHAPQKRLLRGTYGNARSKMACETPFASAPAQFFCAIKSSGFSVTPCHFL